MYTCACISCVYPLCALAHMNGVHAYVDDHVSTFSMPSMPSALQSSDCLVSPLLASLPSWLAEFAQALPLPFQEEGGSIGRMCELFEDIFLHVLHSKPATTAQLEVLSKGHVLATGD